MNTLICQRCNEDARTTKPLIVHYMDRRSSTRQFLFACARCDCTDLWPVFTLSSPRIPKE